MDVRLPTKLTKIEPVIAAVFEVRALPAASPFLQAVPALMFGKFGADVRIEAVNQGVRADNPFDGDANTFVPRMKLSWNDIDVMVGERTVACAFEGKYIGGREFEARIRAVYDLCFTSGIFGRLIRYSFRYVNFFPIEGSIGIAKDMDCSFRIGRRQVEKDEINFHIESNREEGYLSILNITSRAMINGSRIQSGMGGIIDSECACMAPPLDVDEFQKDFESRLSHVRKAAKSAFFECFSPDVIDNQMGAEYV